MQLISTSSEEPTSPQPSAPGTNEAWTKDEKEEAEQNEHHERNKQGQENDKTHQHILCYAQDHIEQTGSGELGRVCLSKALAWCIVAGGAELSRPAR